MLFDKPSQRSAESEISQVVVGGDFEKSNICGESDIERSPNTSDLCFNITTEGQKGMSKFKDLNDIEL